MRLSVAASILACASAHAFSDSSPFVLLSTVDIKKSQSIQTSQLQSSSQILISVRSLLSTCPTDRYLLISQPNVHVSDLRCGPDEMGCRRSPKAPSLSREADSHLILSVSEVLGSLSFQDFADHIKVACIERGRRPQVVEHTLKPLPAAKRTASRAAVLSENDNELERILNKAHEEGDFTAIYFSNPNEFKPYEAEFTEPVHMDLKRQSMEPSLHRRQANNTASHGSLFTKYQFFTPAVFMGLLVSFLVLSIVYIGLTALGSLQVSYGAFEKEMGPAAQKKHA